MGGRVRPSERDGDRSLTRGPFSGYFERFVSPTSWLAAGPRRASEDPSTELVELDALRGLAITLVFLMHSEAPMNGDRCYRYGFDALRSFVIAGHTGVSLFFMLSGFLIARPFLRELAGGPHVSRSRYFARRFLRIMPLYVAYVALASFLCAKTPADLLHGLPYLVFLQGFPHLTVPLPNFSWVWWSLAVEAQFYVLLPLAFAFGARGAVVAFIGAVAVYASFATGVWTPATFEGQRLLAHSVVGRMPLFLFGIAGALIYDRWGLRLRELLARSFWLRNGLSDLALAATAYALGRLLHYILYIPPYDKLEVTMPAWHVAEGGLWFVILMLVVLAPLRIKPLLVNRASTMLGLFSYSIYMVHLPLILYVMEQVRRFDPAFVPAWRPATYALSAGIAAVCLAISALTYYAIERPILTMKSRIPLATKRDRATLLVRSNA